MTRDARESLTALVAVSLFVALIFLLPSMLDGVRVPRWLPVASLALSLAILAGHLIRRRRTPR